VQQGKECAGVLFMIDFWFSNAKRVIAKACWQESRFSFKKRIQSTEDQLASSFHARNEKAARQQGSLFFKGE
jgi:hypothetical protein